MWVAVLFSFLTRCRNVLLERKLDKTKVNPPQSSHKIFSYPSSWVHAINREQRGPVGLLNKRHLLEDLKWYFKELRFYQESECVLLSRDHVQIFIVFLKGEFKETTYFYTRFWIEVCGWFLSFLWFLLLCFHLTNHTYFLSENKNWKITNRSQISFYSPLIHYKEAEHASLLKES